MTPGKLWYLGPTCIPFEATAKKVPEDVKGWCREGDKEWRPMSELPGRTRERAPEKVR